GLAGEDGRLARAVDGARTRDPGRDTRLGRSRGDREGARRAGFGLLADRRRAAFARPTQRSRRTLESRGAWAVGRAVVTRLAIIAAIFCILGMQPSQAHRISARSGPAPDGISIPSLTHGQMTVISDNLSAIQALARARVGFDMTTWRLE